MIKDKTIIVTGAEEAWDRNMSLNLQKQKRISFLQIYPIVLRQRKR